MASANDMDSLIDALHEISDPVYPSTFDEIQSIYEDQYGRNWRPRLADDLYPHVEQVRTVKDPRGAALRTIQRHAKGDYKALNSRYIDALKELGREMKPVRYDAPEGGIQIDFNGYVQISEECEERDFSELVSGSDAFELVNNPAFSDLMNAYFPPGLVQEPCGPWEAELTPIG